MSDGLSEELLNLLAKIPQLKVASRSSAFQFKDEKFDLVEIARRLNVAYVLEGSVRKAGNQLRVTAQLIKADDGFHLWSETYDRPLDDIFAIQDSIAFAVVDALKIKLLGGVPRLAEVDPEAYALHLKSRYLHRQWNPESFEKSIEAGLQALALEPDYAEVWAGLAATYLSQAQIGSRDRDEALSLSEEAIEHALRLDPQMPSAWTVSALLQSMFHWDWDTAHKSMKRALELAPEDIRVWNGAALLASKVGNSEEALSWHRRIEAKDPLDMISMYNVGHELLILGRYAEAQASFENILLLKPGDWGSHAALGQAILLQDDSRRALAEFEREADPILAELGRIDALSRLGRETEARDRLAAFTTRHGNRLPFQVAQAHAALADVDEAFRWLDQAYEQRAPMLAFVMTEVYLRALHDDPRWPVFLDRMGLRPYWEDSVKSRMEVHQGKP